MTQGSDPHHPRRPPPYLTPTREREKAETGTLLPGSTQKAHASLALTLCWLQGVWDTGSSQELRKGRGWREGCTQGVCGLLVGEGIVGAEGAQGLLATSASSIMLLGQHTLAPQ